MKEPCGHEEFLKATGEAVTGTGAPVTHPAVGTFGDAHPDAWWCPAQEGSGEGGGVRRAKVWEQRVRVQRQVRVSAEVGAPTRRRASGSMRGSLGGGDIGWGPDHSCT